VKKIGFNFKKERLKDQRKGFRIVVIDEKAAGT